MKKNQEEGRGEVEWEEREEEEEEDEEDEEEFFTRRRGQCAKQNHELQYSATSRWNSVILIVSRLCRVVRTRTRCNAARMVEAAHGIERVRCCADREATRRSPEEEEEEEEDPQPFGPQPSLDLLGGRKGGASLRGLCGDLEALLGVCWAVLSRRKAEKEQKTNTTFKTSRKSSMLTSSGIPVGPLGSFLGRLGGFLGFVVRHLGPSWAILKPS